METSKNNSVVYEKASLMKRFIAYFFDISFWLLSSLILLTIINSAMNTTPWFKSLDNEMITIKNESKLYEDGLLITSYCDQENTFANLKEQNEFLSSRIDEFYANPQYFENNEHITQYNSRRLNALEEGVHLFVSDGDKVIENTVNPSYLNKFYRDEVENYSVGYLFQNSRYGDLTRTFFLKVLIEAIFSITLMFTVFYLILPLTCFKRGRQTIGMKIEKISLINAKAVNISTGRYVGRFFFMLVIMVYLNFFSFLLPAFVSVGMTLLSSKNQSFVNYVLNDYVVDSDSQHIYLDEIERYLAKAKLETATIENKDFIVK